MLPGLVIFFVAMIGVQYSTINQLSAISYPAISYQLSATAISYQLYQ
jgi:hypothetical protein